MRTGLLISGAGHAAAIAALALWGAARPAPPPEIRVTDVRLIPDAVLEARRSSAPEVPATVEAALPRPSAGAPAARPAEAPPPAPAEARAPAAAPPPDAPADVKALAEIPRAEAATEAPELTEPAFGEPGARLIAPDPDRPRTAPVGISRPDRPVLPDMALAPAPKVDSRPAPPPERPAAPAEERRAAAEPAPAPEAPEEPPAREASAPEAAAPKVVSEAEISAGRPPESWPRPRGRPAGLAAVARAQRRLRPAAQTAPTAPPEDAEALAIARALAAAQAAQPARPRDLPEGPPLSAGEKEALRLAIQRCWNLGALSSDALRTTVTVALSLERGGKPIAGSIRMIGWDGPSAAAAERAFDAARRAILRCGRRGLPLPPEKFDRWRDMEITFNPERMRIR